MPELYKYQADAVKALLGGKHFCIAGTGSGKGSISLYWAKAQNKPRLLVITTASKRDVKDELGRNDFEAEADMWFGEGWRKSLSSFETISWAGLVKWVDKNLANIQDYAIIADEVASTKAGVGSQRGRAFLKIASKTNCWTGYTATPGDSFIDLYAYYVATGKVRNKTEFMRTFCVTQSYKGYMEIVDYRHTEILKKWWKEIADTVDTRAMDAELPEATHKVVEFKAPTGYKNVLKTRCKTTGEFIETVGGVCAYLRQMCLTDAKLTWIREFIENLGNRAVIFYNFIEEGNKLEEVIKKALPKDARVWRIDGKRHEIPTAETMGERDVVLVQYQAGSMGLNLQHTHYWISTTPNYSWSISEQARGRIRRVGQKMPQFYYYLKTNGTIEDDIYACLREKGTFAQDVWALQNNIIEEK